MALSTGDKLGPYEILAPLGAGGMGEVYRARDTRLKRDVALKVLPQAFAGDADRMARFQREAETLASLNHPNIAAIYGLEEPALVMELVEGQTLTGPLPLETALEYARQIADALEYAHDRGVIHRDLKPANIMVTPAGVVKLLDFGLAKAMDDREPSGNPATSPTLTMRETQAGVIIGTAGYMSPEQASGKPVDKRADVWAFGVVLFEMLTGRRLFDGETISHTLASVLKDQPDLEQVPARVRRLLRACLEKDAKRRMQAIGDWRLLLEDPAPAQAPAAPTARYTSLAWVIAAAMAIAAGVGLWGWLRPAPPEPRPVIHFSLPLPIPPVNGSIAVSPDGSRVSFSQGRGPGGPIYVRSMDQPEFREIPGTNNALAPVFSPDGQWIASIFPGRQLRKFQLAGGGGLTLVDGLPNFAGAPFVSWGADDQILFISESALMRVPASGGKPENVATPDGNKGENAFAAPQLLPGGRAVLLSVAVNSIGVEDRIVVLDLKTGQKTTLANGAGIATFIPSPAGSDSGYVIYGRGGSLFAFALDAKRLRAGAAVPIVNGVRGAPRAAFGISDSGTLAYIPGSAAEQAEGPAYSLVWVDRQGKETPIPAPPRNYTNLSLSPDGEKVALQVDAAVFNSTSDIWVYDLARGTSTRVTTEKNNGAPVWTPDGKRLLHVVSATPSGRGGIMPVIGALVSTPADGSGASVTLVADGQAYVPTSVSADGKLAMGIRSTSGTVNPQTGRAPSQIWVMPLAQGSKPELFVDTPFLKSGATFSPDGKWVAYHSSDSGRNEIYVVPYPGPGGRTIISTDGGSTPRWARNGRELFYRAGDRNGSRMMAVDVQTSPTFRAGKPKVLFEYRAASPGYDVAPDGRFLMIRNTETPRAPDQAGEVHIIVNWIEELKRRVPAIK